MVDETNEVEPGVHALVDDARPLPKRLGHAPRTTFVDSF